MESYHTHPHTNIKNDMRPSARFSWDFPWVIIFWEIVFNVLLIFFWLFTCSSMNSS